MPGRLYRNCLSEFHLPSTCPSPELPWNHRALDEAKADIFGMQQAMSLGRIRSSSKDRQAIIRMKSEIEAALTPFTSQVRLSITRSG